MSARPDGETLAVGVTDAVVVAAVAGLEIGEAVGACANELIASAREQMYIVMNLFIVDDLTVGCVQPPIWIQLFQPSGSN